MRKSKWSDDPRRVVYGPDDKMPIRYYLAKIYRLHGDYFRNENQKIHKKYSSQAERVVIRFGGNRNMAKLMTESGFPIKPENIENWRRGKAKGQKYPPCGRIPAHWWDAILITARLQGIVLTDEDITPRLVWQRPPSVYFNEYMRPHSL